MADRINFSKKINDSVQVGDELYLTNIDQTPIPPPLLVGIIDKIGEKYVIVDTAFSMTGGATLENIFYMFRKPVEQNVSSLKGYYAESTFTNNSTSKQELFAVGSEVTMSSK